MKFFIENKNKFFQLLVAEIFLVFLFLSSVSTVRLNAQNKLALNSQNKATSKMKLIVLNGVLGKDLGAGIQDSTWICGLDGRVYRFDPMNVVHNILNQAPPCIRVDIDYEGLPWLITSGHKIWRLMHEYTENFRWVKLDGKIFIYFRMWS